ncbi:MAG: type I-C CRISPR-associated protein Cas5c [Terracidiphilus sp.]|nr:type I-C CRISPR-associated protein Cas5c [Terracidiphilus sp.]
MSTLSVRVRVSGRYACFTRPETKVERFTYPVMTPSAARNVLDSICWRPQMRWVVTAISVLRPIRTFSVLRNEVQSKLAPGSVKKWMKAPETFEPLVAGAGQGTDATPRNTTLLYDVAYWIDAYPLVFDTSGDNTPAKYVAMLNRRVEKGQCFQRPYLGCREFAAGFSTPIEGEKPIEETLEIGRMLYDIAFDPAGNRATFFDARLIDGVLNTDPAQVLPDEDRRGQLLRRTHPGTNGRPATCCEEVAPCSSRC